jgi:transitional endoplasmic reticulum ATPase
MENRVINHLEKGMEKGENTFFFYGEYIHDWFLYDLYHGVYGLSETLKKYFLDSKKSDYFFYCKQSEFKAYKEDKDKGKIIDCGDELFKGKEDPGDDSQDLSIENNKNKRKDGENEGGDNNGTSGTQKNVSDATRGASAELSSFEKAVKKCREEKSKQFTFFFDDYEWTTGLYKASNDEQLSYVEKVKELSSLKNVVVIVAIEEVQMLKKYNFKLDGNNVVMLGSPATEELFQTYLRKYIRTYLKEYKKEPSIKNEFLAELRKISEAVASGEKSLKEALRIFDRVMSEKKYVLDKKDFEGALDKIIEEKVYLEDVVLSDDIKNDIVNTIDKFLQAEKVSEITKGLILTGPPGTGKTYLVKALANEKNCYFMSPSLADLKAEYVGQTGPKIKRIFQQARANAPTIMFIDEADTIFPNRDFSGSDSDSYAKDMVNQFLVEMDGLLTGESRVFVVAATNRVNILDSAIKSRLGNPVEIPLPDKTQRKQLFSKLLTKEGLMFEKFNFVDEFLDKTNHMSGRDIKNFVDTMRIEAQKSTRRIADYKDESETKDLFYVSLKKFEEDFVRNLREELQIKLEKPSDKENRVTFKDIIGCKNAKDVIKYQMKYFDIKEQNNAKNYGIKPKKGILLYGPPGNGKTEIADAASNEYNLYFMKITSETFTKASLSEQNQILVKIFSSALQLSEMCGEQKGVLLFFDEFDALAAKSQLDLRVRGALLPQLDNKETLRNPKTKILFMAATNHYERLDEATIRTGRFDDKIEIQNPTEEEGADMITHFCDSNNKVCKLKEGQADRIYKTYLEKYRESRKNSFIRNYSFEWKLEGKEEKELKTRAENLSKEYSPSAADIKGYVERLVSTAYYQESMEDEDGLKKIKITEGVENSVYC